MDRKMISTLLAGGTLKVGLDAKASSAFKSLEVEAGGEGKGGVGDR